MRSVNAAPPSTQSTRIRQEVREAMASKVERPEREGGGGVKNAPAGIPSRSADLAPEELPSRAAPQWRAEETKLTR
jgi:hypothetical protein